MKTVDSPTALTNLGIALLLGLLVGLQRERTESRVAGLRTFGLITVLGCVSGILAQQIAGGAWIIAAVMVTLIAALFIGNMLSMRTAGPDPGITTEVAALVMFLVGAMVVIGPRDAAVATGGGVAILLQLKPRLQAFVKTLGENDVRAIMQFALITAIILPIVPDKGFGPFGVVNLHQLWLMVVLVVGISLFGYLAYRVVGAHAGLLMSGILGGLISSTATTVSYSRRAAGAPSAAQGAAFVIAAASTVLYGRLLAEIWAAAPTRAGEIMPPVVVLGTVSVAMAAVMWGRAKSGGNGLPEQKNPSELRVALVFALVYGVVLVAAAAAHEYIGDRGIYAVAAVSGISDMDAITLSASRLAMESRISSETAWRAIVTGAIANTMFKYGMVVALGGPELARRLVVVFSVKIAAAIGVLVFWPGN